MLIGGVAFSFFSPPWQYEGEMTLVSFVAILFVLFFGTLPAFSYYLESLNYLKANETSLLSCAEPLSAAILAVLWLKCSLWII
jgi:drug/metabolite transporter (DMT)-like permease